VKEAKSTVDDAGFIAYEITPTAQAWANGEPNYGLIIVKATRDDAVFSSSEVENAANRPLLTVTFSKLSR
jgi:hypothetical protein